MKKLFSMLLVCALVFSTISGITVFAAEETVTVVAGGSWTDATYDAETGVLMNKEGGYGFTVVFYDETTYYINLISGQAITAGTVYVPQSFTTADATYTCTGVGSYFLCSKSGGTNTTVKKVVLPDTITTIGSNAFRGNTALEEVNMPEGITSIGGYAFLSCSALKSIYIPAGVTSIGKETFKSCTALASVTFADGSKVATISEGVFNGCTSLKSIELPSSVTKIDKNTFGNTGLTSFHVPAKLKTITAGAFAVSTALAEFTVDPSNSYWVAEDGLLMNKAKTNILAAAPKGTAEVLVIPETVTTISSHAFRDNLSTKSVTLSPAVKTLNASAFRNGKFEEFNFAQGGAVTAIPESCFYECKSLKAITFPEGITSIGKSSMSHCTALESVSFPSTITAFSTAVFYGCSKLANVTFAEGFVWPSNTIPSQTFRGCSALAQFDIPDYITTISNLAFANTKIASIVIPAGVTFINQEAFTGCASLEKVIFKGVVTEIQYRGFMAAPLSGGLIFEAGVAPTTLGSNSITSNTAVIYYPANKSEFAETTVFGTKKVLPFGGHIAALADDGVNTIVTYSVADVYDNATLLATIALYDGDALVGVKSAVDVAGTEITFENVTGADYAKIYVWNTLASAKPLYESFEYPAQ